MQLVYINISISAFIMFKHLSATTYVGCLSLQWGCMKTQVMGKVCSNNSIENINTFATLHKHDRLCEVFFKRL